MVFFCCIIVLMKIPKCKYCGKEGHYAYQCFKKRAEQKPKKPTAKRGNVRKQLIAELDKITSELVRKKACGSDGFAFCFTCGVRKPWQMLDCGHFRSRRFTQTRFDFDNLRPQCRECNRYKHGNLGIYRQKLVRELGEQKVKEIETRPPRKIMEIELEQLLEQRRQELKNVK